MAKAPPPAIRGRYGNVQQQFHFPMCEGTVTNCCSGSAAQSPGVVWKYVARHYPKAMRHCEVGIPLPTVPRRCGSVWQDRVVALVPHCPWGAGSGTLATHYLNPKWQWAVGLLPHCLGSVGKDTRASHCHNALG